MNMNEKISIPAIKGIIGNNVYYTANLTLAQVCNLVDNMNDELYNSPSLNDILQRSLTSNFEKIKEYILSQDERFFNSLVLAIYDDYPQWTELDLKVGDIEYDNVGILTFLSNRHIFPVDGQHRVEGIKAAVKVDTSLASETIGVLFIGHQNTPEGKVRTRRIFTTLNRYAKPVKQGDIISLDEDNIVSIVTRYILESHPLLKGDRMKKGNLKAISPNDSSTFTTLISLYEVHKSLFRLYYFTKFKKRITSKELVKYTSIRPDDSTIDEFYSFLLQFWNSLADNMECIGNYLRDDGPSPASKYRLTNEGGNLLFRPVGLESMTKAIVRILIACPNSSLQAIIKIFNGMDMNLSHFPWKKVLWNDVEHTMITLKNNTQIAELLFVYYYDSSLLSEKETKKIVKGYSSASSLEESSVEELLSHFVQHKIC